MRFYDCEICGSIHPWDWNGDCRDDKNRFADPVEIEERLGVSQFDQEILSMDDRVREDEQEQSFPRSWTTVIRI